MTLRLLILVLLLAGCAAPPSRPDEVRERIGSELTQAANNRKSAETAERGLLAPLTVDMPQQENGNGGEHRFDLSVVNAPAAQVLMAIVSNTRYNMLIGPDVAEKIRNITINLRDVNVMEALDSLRDLYDFDFVVKGNRILIQPNALQTKVFQVNYLANTRHGASDLSVTSSSTAGGASTTSTPSTGTTAAIGGTGNQSRTGSVSSQVQTKSDTDFWGDLTRAIDTIVSSEGSSRVVNSISGVVVIRGLPRELRAVERYLKATQVMVERQVMLEAKILEVELSEGYQAGINWSSFSGENNRLSIGVANKGSILAPTGYNSVTTITEGNFTSTLNNAVSGAGVLARPGVAGGLIASALGNGFVGLAFQAANFAALLNFLETQGTVSVLSSPRIATINNQKAVLKVGTDEYFITRVTGGSSTNSATTGTVDTLPNVETAPFFSGISLDVTPQIDADGNIILHVRPAISTVEQANKDFKLNGRDYSLPMAKSNVKETDSIVRVQDGNIVAIGGMMSQRQVSDRSGLPGTLNSAAGALAGQRGSALTKREMVILLKPTVIGDDRAWVKDLEQSSERLRHFDLPPLAVPVR